MTPLELIIENNLIFNGFTDPDIPEEFEFRDYYENTSHFASNSMSVTSFFNNDKLIGYYIWPNWDGDIVEMGITQYGSELLFPYLEKLINYHIEKIKNEMINRSKEFDESETTTYFEFTGKNYENL